MGYTCVGLYRYAMKNRVEIVSFDEMVDALADVQRRKLLVALLEHNPQDDAPVVIAGSEEEGEAVDRLVKMNHVHLPNLEELGFIEWDRDANEVSKGENFEEIRPLLELLVNHEDELPADWL